MSVGSLSLEIESPDKDWIEAKLKEYRALVDAIKSKAPEALTEEPLSAGLKQTNRTLKPGLSANEFYRQYVEKRVKSRIELGVFFVYYLTQLSDKKEFTSTEVKDIFRKVGYPNWNKINVPDVLYQAKKRALLNNVGNLWSLSMTGEDFVLSKISANE
jgi:hypothetical protein